MDPTERAHVEQLLQISRAHLHELEKQAAALGLAAPPHVAVQLAEYRRNVAELEQRLNAALPRHNLPPRDYERFVGRQQELAEVRRLLLPYPKSRHHLVTIDGIGGIGKSALALEIAYIFRDDYAALPDAERFDAIVWVSAKRTYLTADGILQQRQVFRALDDLYAAIAQVLDYPAITRAPAAEQRAIVEQVLADHRTLLILDNLETVDDEELLVFLRLLPDPTKAIVTTRHRIDVAYPVRLTGMPHDDAIALIQQEAARKEVELGAGEQEQLWTRTGGVPLAVVWSIGLMGLGGSIESVLRRLGQGQSDIARFCFEESVAQIRGRDAHKLLLALSLFASDASREALGVVAGLGEDEFGRDLGLEELLRLSLVKKEGERFGLLPLTLEYARAESVVHTPWVQQAQQRLHNYFYQLTTSELRHSDSWQGHDRVERELANLFILIDELVANLRYQQIDEGGQLIEPASVPQAGIALNIINAVAYTCRIRGYWNECEKLCITAISIGRSIKDTDSIGWRCYDLGRIKYFLGELSSAKYWLLESRKEWQFLKDEKRICHANRLLGQVAFYEGDVEEGIALSMLAMEGYKLWEEPEALPYYLEINGDIAEYRGDLATAIMWHRETVEVLRQQNNIPYLAAVLRSLGRVALAANDVNGAQTYYSESLKLAGEWRLIGIMAQALYDTAFLESTQNQRQLAESHARQALDLFRRLGMKREQAEAEALLARLEAGA